MTTLAVAIDALITVGHDYFLAHAGDPTYGTLYANMVWESRWPFNVYKDTFPTIFLYEYQGSADRKGLGFVEQWRYPILRADLFANQAAHARQMFEALRAAWIADFNNMVSPYTPGLGYLRHTGGLKTLEIGESRSTDWDERGVVFRRTVDIRIEIGD
jgi:hypothetical protein